MSIRDPDLYGIVTTNAERRALWGDRVCHGKVGAPPPTPGVLAATVNPFERVKREPKPTVPVIISEDIMRRVENLEAGTTTLQRSLDASSEAAGEIERAVGLLAGLAEKRRTVPLERILAAVAATFDVTGAEIVGPSRSQTVTRPRFAFCRLAKRHAGISSTKLGYFLGLRDHTSVLNAWRRSEKLMVENEDWRAKYDAAELLIAAPDNLEIVRPQACEL